jgi:TolA-binding protein
MNRNFENIDNNSIPERNDWYDDSMLFSKDDTALFVLAGELLKAGFDIEDVLDDPAYAYASELTAGIVSEYKDKGCDPERVQFISDSLAEARYTRGIRHEISDIEQEIREKDIDKIAAGWVENHLSDRQKGIKDPKKEEIRSFISGSLSGIEEKKPALRRSLVARYALLAAASIAGIFFLYRSLVPSSDPDSLYKSYYAPFEAVSAVTRGTAGQEAESFSDALECYKNGDFTCADKGFAGAFISDSSNIGIRFYLGLTKMALADYSRAIGLLEGVVKSNAIFREEAEWYLGLAYVKTGNKAGARSCFRDLEQSDYFGKRSETILRRLK